MERLRGDGGEAQLSWLLVPLAAHQAHLPLARVFKWLRLPCGHGRPLWGCSQRGRDVGLQRSGERGGLRGLFVPLLVFGPGGANHGGSGLPAPLRLGQLSWGKLASDLH